MVSAPAEVCGIPVVSEASALGLTFVSQPTDGAAAAAAALSPAAAATLTPAARRQRQTEVALEAWSPCRADWHALLTGMRRACSKLARLPLSTFGRAIASSAYGISKLLYHAEFVGLPAWVATDVTRMLAALVDRGQPPGAPPGAPPGEPPQPPPPPPPPPGGRARRAAAPAAPPAAPPRPPPQCHAFPGLHPALLPGRPANGGFGLLPVLQHVVARHAMWGMRLLSYLAATPGGAGPDATPAWVDLAAAALRRSPVVGRHPPALAMLILARVKSPEQQRREQHAAAVGGGGGVRDPSLATLPPALCMMLRAMRQLGRPGAVTAQGRDQAVASLAPLAVALPLWGNVFVLEARARTPPAGADVTPWDANTWWGDGSEHYLEQMPGLFTLGDLYALLTRVKTWHAANRDVDDHSVWSLSATLGSRSAYLSALSLQSTLSTVLVAGSMMEQPHVLYEVLLSFWVAVPQPWQAVIEAADPGRRGRGMGLVSTADSRAAAVRQLLCFVGWRRATPTGELAAPSASSPPITLGPAPLRARVRDLTPLLCIDGARLRSTRHQQFVLQAVRGVAEPAAAAAAAAAPAAAAAGGAVGQLQLPDDLEDDAAVAAAVDAAPAQEPAAAPAAPAVAAPPPPQPPQPLRPQPPAPPLADLSAWQSHFQRLLPELWALRWDNKHKQTFWRMAVNGVAGAGGRDICPAGPCPCRWELPAPCRGGERVRELQGAPLLRQHTFWACPVARAVVAAVRSALPPAVRPALTRAHLWLCAPPAAGMVNVHVWRVVCLAALSAMEYGRRLMWALHLGGRERAAGADAAAGPDLRQLTLHEAWGVEPPSQPVAAEPPITAVERARRSAVADFWCRLQDFVLLHAPCDPKRWPGANPTAEPPLTNADHPFMRILTDGGGGAPAAADGAAAAQRPRRRLCLALPPGAAAVVWAVAPATAAAAAAAAAAPAGVG